MFPLLQTSPDGFNFNQNPSSYNFESLLIILIAVIIIPIALFFAFMMYRLILKSRSTSNEWKEFHQIMQRSDLSREEAFFLKQTLKKRKVKNPSEVVKEPKVFERVIQKPLKRPSAHTEHLIMSIRQKVFGS